MSRSGRCKSDRTVIVTRCGRICYQRRKINLSTVFAGQKIGIKEVSDRIWLVTLPFPREG